MLGAAPVPVKAGAATNAEAPTNRNRTAIQAAPAQR